MELPEYLNNFNHEFIGINDNLYRIKVELIHFVDFDSSTKLELSSLLDKDLIAQVSLDQLGIKDEDEQLHKYGLCNYGGFDNKADITIYSNQNEYFDCGQRGSCPVEGKLCKHIKTRNGYITPREIEVIKLIAEDLADKQIADRLKISVFTVNTHRKNIQHKIGCASKVGICRFAIERRII